MDDSTTAQLADGGEVSLRPLASGEDEPLQAVFAGLSAGSRHHRYLVGMSRLPGPVATALIDVDGYRQVAWLASVAGRPVGIARYLRVGGDAAEIAFEVVDEHHRRGIGGVLLDAITTAACASGIRSVEATVAPGNLPSLRLLTRLGLLFEPRDGLLAGSARLRLLDPSRVDRRAVVALARRPASCAGELAGCRVS